MQERKKRERERTYKPEGFWMQKIWKSSYEYVMEAFDRAEKCEKRILSKTPGGRKQAALIYGEKHHVSFFIRFLKTAYLFLFIGSLILNATSDGTPVR